MFEHTPFKNGQLIGHNSPDTAYVVDDYPYGFRARTTIRYWIETTKHGQRAVSQTKNPKTGQWNKSRAGTYSDIEVMGLDVSDHVTFDGITMGRDEPEVLTFKESFVLDEYQTKRLHLVHGFARGQKYITYTITSGYVTKDGMVDKDGNIIPPSQTQEEQREITKKAAMAGLSEVMRENALTVKDVI